MDSNLSFLNFLNLIIEGGGGVDSWTDRYYCALKKRI